MSTLEKHGLCIGQSLDDQVAFVQHIAPQFMECGYDVQDAIDKLMLYVQMAAMECKRFFPQGHMILMKVGKSEAKTKCYPFVGHTDILRREMPIPVRYILHLLTRCADRQMPETRFELKTGESNMIF
jgi:hypothetical protein